MSDAIRSPFLLAALLAAGPALAAPTLSIYPGEAHPGDIYVVSVEGASALPEGTVGEHRLSFFPTAGGYRAIAGLSAEVAPGTLEIRVRALDPGFDRGMGELVGSLEVLPAAFRESELKVDPKYVKPPAKVKKWIAEDTKAFNRAFDQAFASPAFAANFVWPVETSITAPFGDRRLFNGKKQSQHMGIDLEGVVGDPVLASNDGTVVMARECYSSGNTVMIHHGANLYTLYFHLSKLEVEHGMQVKRGAPLGQVGNTGRVTGPHLHFGVKVDGTYVSAESLMRASFE